MVEKVELKEIINQIRGVSYGKNDVSDTKVDGYVPVLRSNNIQDSRIDLSDLVYVKPEKVKPVQFLKKGDILITASTGSLKVIGKNAQCKDDLNASFGAFCKVVRVKDADHSYLGHLFQSPQYFSYIQNIVNGANINNIKNEHIDNFKIPLPPLKTQQKIAQILDNAAALRYKTAQLLEEYELLAQSIFLELFGDPCHNSKDFEKVKINYFIKKLETGKSVNSTNEVYSTDKLGILKTSCVYTGTFNPMEAKVIKDSEIQLAKLNPKKDSIIISRMNTEELVGKSAYVFKDFDNLFLPDRLWQTVKSEIKHSVLWLSYAISQDSFIGSISRVSTGTSGSMKNISQKNFLNLEIIHPPIELQTQFAQKIALIERQKELAKQELNESEYLFNCLLQKAFKGEL